MFQPKDAKKLLNGSYYKRGAHGRIFYFINGCWLRSAITESQYRNAPETLEPRPIERDNNERNREPETA